MSLQVNSSSPDITKAYQDVLNARGIDWVVLTYEKASNDLRVQSTGNGLEDLEEEFSDGRSKPHFSPIIQSISPIYRRIQYVFARVTDPNVRSADVLLIQRLIDYQQTKLPKFVQINWCGDGVPEAKKGLFHTHSTTVSRFFRGTHVVISARNEVRHSCFRIASI